MRTAIAIVVSLLAYAVLSTQALASQSATLHVAFTPDRLGRSTNVEFGIDIDAPADSVPAPLTALELRYPRQLGLAVSGLGLETCMPQRLEAFGPILCPPDSRMGQGRAVAEIAFGPDIIRETAEVSIVRGPEQEGHIGLLFYTNAGTPDSAQVAFPGELLPAPPPQQESIYITVPLVHGLPGGPDVAVVELRANLGPRGLTYYERVHGKRVAYHPQGILLPDKCPRGGFPFTAALTFLDGSHSQADADVPCPGFKKK
jgi:hypothetical protein